MVLTFFQRVGKKGHRVSNKQDAPHGHTRPPATRHGARLQLRAARLRPACAPRPHPDPEQVQRHCGPCWGEPHDAVWPRRAETTETIQTATCRADPPEPGGAGGTLTEQSSRAGRAPGLCCPCRSCGEEGRAPRKSPAAAPSLPSRPVPAALTAQAARGHGTQTAVLALLLGQWGALDWPCSAQRRPDGGSCGRKPVSWSAARSTGEVR